MLIKLLCSILIFTGCTFIGLSFSASIKKRPVELKRMKDAINFLQNEICFLENLLPEALENSGSLYGGFAGEVMLYASAKLKGFPGIPFTDIWKEAVETTLKDSPFSSGDKALLTSMGNMISNKESDWLSRNLQNLANRLESHEKSAAETAKKSGNLYRKLGMLGGLIIIILLI